MIAYNRFDVKNPAEKIVLTFDMTLGLATGETLTGSPSVSVAVFSGTDGSPSAILNGSAALDSSGLLILVPVQAGLDQTDYYLTVSCATTNALKLLALSAILPVRA
jgi:hypothetical protein